ncbi:MAG: cyclic nucleotide-binding domain-containing protein [Chloroflexi bacterium]|nr:cyclic nucleotide-binding domain-containing protein [Chloroflexota bacterium]
MAYDDTFDQHPIFQSLSAEQRAVLRPLFTLEEYPAGTTLFTQGEPAEYLYMIVAGDAALRYKPDDGPVITLARVRPGGVVGWSALLGNHDYTSSAVCEAATVMLRARGAELRRLCGQDLQTGEAVVDRLAAAIAERLRSSHQQVVALLKEGMHASMQSV